MDQWSLSRVSVEVFSSIEDWASKLLLGGGKVKGWTMFCCACVFFRETPVIQLRGRRLGPSRLCKWSAIWHLERSPSSLATGGFFLPCLQKMDVHGMNERKFPGREKPFLLSLSFSFPSNFQGKPPKIAPGPRTFVGIPHVNRLLGCWVLGICWDLLGNRF